METTFSLNKLKKVDFMTKAVRDFFPDARHKLISNNDMTDPELGKCIERIGYFFLFFYSHVIFTCANISLGKTKKELIEDLMAQKKPYGELLRDYYPDYKIESKTISFEENVQLPGLFNQTNKIVSKHIRFILVNGEKVSIAVEYI